MMTVIHHSSIETNRQHRDSSTTVFDCHNMHLPEHILDHHGYFRVPIRRCTEIACWQCDNVLLAVYHTDLYITIGNSSGILELLSTVFPATIKPGGGVA